MKKILIIAPQYYPIPAVKGGAVECLLTSFINYNELNKNANLYVVSKKDSEAKKIKFKYCNIYYINSDYEEFNFKEYFLYCLYFFWMIIRKILHRNENVNYNFFGFYVSSLTKKIKPDIFLSEGYDKLSRLWQASKMVGPQNCYYHLHYAKTPNSMERALFYNSICVSDYIKNKWNCNPNQNEKNTVIYNGIDLNKYSQHSVDLDKVNYFKNKYHIFNDDFVVMFAGRFRPGKGIIELIEAFNYIQNKKIKLLLVGDFVKTFNDEKAFEESILYGIKSNKSIIHVGRIDQEDMPCFYYIADILVVPSTCEEAAGLVAIEGMSFGLPIIYTNSGGLPEYVDENCGIRIALDKHLSTNIYKAILKLFNNHKLCEKMGFYSKEKAKSFSVQKYCEELFSYLINSSE